MGRVRVRTLGEEDVQLAAQTLRSIKPPEELRGRLTDQEIAPFLADPHALLAVATDGKSPLGYAVAYELPRADGGASMMLLYELVVAESHRGCGIGKTLVAHLKGEAIQRGTGRMWVLAEDGNDAALGLYATSGARRVPSEQVLLVWPLRKGP
jgi:ribosomal protein S18 acetylase RimI-like enzyme